MSILKNIKKIKTFVNPKVKIVAVISNHSIREINQVLFLDINNVAQTNVFEAKKQKSLVKYPASWHMIGALKKRELKEVVEIFDLIQSVDSFEIANAIDLICRAKKKKIAILIKVNISGQKNISGVRKEHLLALLKKVSTLKNIFVIGLLCQTPPVVVDFEPYFKDMKNLFNSIKKENLQGLKMKYLSMGASQNYVSAINNNSNMILLDKVLFDDKKNSTVNPHENRE